MKSETTFAEGAALPLRHPQVQHELRRLLGVLPERIDHVSVPSFDPPRGPPRYSRSLYARRNPGSIRHWYYGSGLLFARRRSDERAFYFLGPASYDLAAAQSTPPAIYLLRWLRLRRERSKSICIARSEIPIDRSVVRPP